MAKTKLKRSATRSILGAKYWPPSPPSTKLRNWGVSKWRKGGKSRNKLAASKPSPQPQSTRSRPPLSQVVSAAPAPQAEPIPASPAAPSPDSGGQPGVSTSPYSPEQEAQDKLNLEFSPKIAALLRQQQQGKNTFQAGVTGTQQYGAGFDVKLNEIYDKLRAQLQGGQQQVAGTYQQAQQSIGGGYDTAAAALARAGGEAAQGQGEMAPAESRLQQFLAMAKAQNEQGKAASLGNLSSTAAAANTNLQGGINAAAEEGATQRANLVKQITSQLGNLNLTQLKNDAEIQGELTNLESQKASAYRTLLQQVKDARTEQEATAAKDAFAREIQENTLQIQMAKLGLATDKQSFDQGLASQKFGLDTQKFGADVALRTGAQALTQRGQDLTRQSAVERIAATTAKEAAKTKAAATKAKAAGLTPQQKRVKQNKVVDNLKRSASKNTQDAFFYHIGAAPTYQKALALLNEVSPEEFKKEKVSKKSLEAWLRQYYYYK